MPTLRSLFGRVSTDFRPIRPAREASRKARSGRPPSVQALEGRELLSTFTVSNANDSGPGSFRQAIVGADAQPGASTIDFHIGKGSR